MSASPSVPATYAAFLDALKRRVQEARQAEDGWGSRVIDRLAADLHASFPDMEGFSPRNLRRMRAFYLAWRDAEPILPQAVAELPWGHNAVLLEKLPSPELRRWYAERAIQHGWSRAILTLQIEGQLHRRAGQALSNFPATLPPPDSDLAQQATRDPYLFNFLGLYETASEREVERALMQHIERFLLELGAGFAFIGRQVRLDIGDEEHWVNLLFYRLKLRCYVVIELKARPFDSRDVGQLNMYLSAVDDQLRQPTDGPTSGLLLCKGKNRVKAEYALRGSLPTVEEIERELAGEGA